MSDSSRQIPDTDSTEPIAIVGMSARFGGADNLQEFWQMCCDGTHAFEPVPADRWDHSAFFDPDGLREDTSYCPTGAFIRDIRSFPALQLKIPPRQAEVMDPQQRLVLELSTQAIEDSGTPVSAVPPNTGVYIGVTSMEHNTLMTARVAAQLMAQGKLGEAPENPDILARAVERLVPARPFTATGALPNMVAATTAQKLGLTGPAFTVDAACASSLVAVADGVFALRQRRIDAALVGGVYVCLTPEQHIAFSQVGALSHSGVCRPFDARGDGFVQGDGCGILMLKRYRDALENDDRVYALINGIAINNDGGGEGAMAPVAEGQIEVIDRAFADAGIDRQRLGYLETHGTGTEVGDRTELSALSIAFPRAGFSLGSSKANVGHTQSAAGAAGLIRAACAVYFRRIPPLANFESIKPDLASLAGAFDIPGRGRPWQSRERVAGVSSFGFGGTNLHAVISSADRPGDTLRQPELLLFSAPDTETLRRLCGQMHAAIARDPGVSVASVARSLNVRKPLAARLAIVTADTAELLSLLASYTEGGAHQKLITGTSDDSPAVAFLFPGQAAQRVGMLRGIEKRFPVVRETLRELDAALRGRLEHSLEALLFPERRESPINEEEAAALLTRPEHSQPVLFAAGVALSRVLAQVGVTPRAVLGHSAGEFTAACVAEALAPAEGVRFVTERGLRMTAKPGDPGAMAAISANADTVEPLLSNGVVIANYNHPRQVVISGPSEALDEVCGRARETGLHVKVLPVSHAFHSPLMDGVELADLLDALPLRDGTVAQASTVLDHPLHRADHFRRAFELHLTSPVRFTQGLQQCVELGAELFVELAAGGPLRSLARGVLGKHGPPVVSLASADDDDHGESLLQGLGQLWVRGVDLDTTPITHRAAPASLPPAILPRQVYWPIGAERRANAQFAGASKPDQVPDAAPVQPSPIVSPRDSADSAEAAVLTAVAEAGDYPIESLSLNMTLFDDLGMDSLMATEVLIGLEEAVPGLTDIPQEVLTGNPTIRDVVAFVREQGGLAPATDTTADTQRSAFTLHPESHPYLNDHIIDGQPVLPMAMAVALLADATEQPPPIALAGVKLYRGIVVSEAVPAVVLRRDQQLELRFGPDNELAYGANLQDTAAIPQLDTEQSPLVQPELTLESFYADITFHGPMLQGVLAVEGIGSNRIRGVVATSSRREWLPVDEVANWIIDPLTLDAAMQLAGFALWQRARQRVTPVSIGQYVQFAVPADDSCIAEVIFDEEALQHNEFKASIRIFRHDGQTLAMASEVVGTISTAGESAEPPTHPEWTDPERWPEYRALKEQVHRSEMLGIANPYFDMHDGTARNTTLINGKEIINFSSYNYLGLSGEAKVEQDVFAAIKRYGTSVSASRVVSGERPFHKQLEQRLAAHQGAEAAVVMGSGYSTNVSTVGHLFGPRDLIIHDELIHDSCLQGIRLSGATRRFFRHQDTQHLDDLLREHRHRYQKTLVLTEGVYSMDGDIVRLPEILDIKERHECMLMVDEAHSFGTVGLTGRGVGEHFGIDTRRVDIWMGTLSKSLAAMGGWIAGGNALIEYLKYTGPGFVFAAGLAPALGQASLTALRLMTEEPWRIERLQGNSLRMYKLLLERGLDMGCASGQSPVIPVIVGDSMMALRLSQSLLEQGINAKPIVYPAVSEDTARIRLFITALHTDDELLRSADAIATSLQSLQT